MTKDHYAVLGLEPSCTTKEIIKAYRQRALLVHPDKNIGNPGATKKFQELGNAYEILQDAGKRRKYDATRPRKTHKAEEPQMKDPDSGHTPEEPQMKDPDSGHTPLQGHCPECNRFCHRANERAEAASRRATKKQKKDMPPDEWLFRQFELRKLVEAAEAEAKAR